MKLLWERAKKQISESESRIRAETQLIHGEEYEVWRWIQPRSPSPQRRPRSVRMSFFEDEEKLLFVSGITYEYTRRKLCLHAT